MNKWIPRAAIALGALGIVSFVGQRVAYLSAEPGKDKQCDPVDPTLSAAEGALPEYVESQKIALTAHNGIVNDASCVDQTLVYGVVAITSEDDLKNALQYAREHDLKVTPAGVRHSMGGHAFSKGNMMLDMRQMNGISVDEGAMTMTVGGGATWHDIQNVLHPRFAVKAMQSTDIFTVGGSISVNAHGMDHTAGAVENTIRSMRIMKPDGTIVTVSRTENADLYEHIVGGYGLFGIIVDATLDIVPNVVYESSRRIVQYDQFPAVFDAEIKGNDDIGLMYTHLSTAPGKSFLREGIMYVYTKSPHEVALEEIPPLGSVSSVKLRRLVMNLSKRGDVFQTLRWWSEKYLEPRMESCSISRTAAQGSGEACMVARNEPMHDSVPYLRDSLRGETDILHEYFIPRRNLVSFIDGLRESILAHDATLLNASIRVVNKENGALSYAPEEAFSVVLYINQKTTPEGHEKMRALTSDLIDLSQRNGGRFFLPYQRYYSKEQLRASYPMIDDFFVAKRKYDPGELFTNTWYETYGRS